ncbi:MAG: NADPH-dependent FMN reductase [Brumimicrobium sp.]
MKILAISGSASVESSNVLLLEAIQRKFSNDYEIEVYQNLRNLPLFKPEDLDNSIPTDIRALREKVVKADAIIISTPEYTHNIPAVLKNAFEWMTGSGELVEKQVLAITFTPHKPRGEHAMKSLLFTLKAMNTRVVTQVSLHKTDVTIEKGRLELGDEVSFMLDEAMKLL